MENFEKFKTFKTVDTAEDLAEATPKAYEGLRKANEMAAKSFFYKRFGVTPERKVLAENEVAVVELAFKDFQEKIQNEAETYVVGYEDYTKRFKEAAAAMGIQAEPSSIDEFIWQVDRSIGDEARMFGTYRDDFGGPERRSFHASPEAQKRSIDRAIIGDLLTERVPKGTEILLEAGSGAVTTTRDSRRPRVGMVRAAALASAKERGAPVIISVNSSRVENYPGQINGRYTGKSESYFPVPPEVAALLTDDPKGNRMIPDVYGNGYWANDTFLKAENGRTMRFAAVYEAVPTADIESAENPVNISLMVGEHEISISAASSDTAIDQLMMEIMPEFKGNAPMSSSERLARLQQARIKMPDGTENTVMDLTPALLEKTRRSGKPGPDAQAA